MQDVASYNVIFIVVPGVRARGRSRGRGGSRGRGRGRGKTGKQNMLTPGVSTVPENQTQGREEPIHTRIAKDRQNVRNVGTTMSAANGKCWTVVDSGKHTVGRAPMQNILRDKSGPTPTAKLSIDKHVVSAFHLLIDKSILEHIKECTETEARHQLLDVTWCVTVEELYAFIGLLYLRGVCGAKRLPLATLWSSQWGIRFFAETMSRNRFQEIMRFIRFDIKATRSERLLQDKFALISEVWNRFINNCVSNYRPGSNITVDEQLFPTKCRCKFIQYMASKPDKFGIKFWLAVDVESKYLLNGFPYLGKDETRPSDQSVSENVVLRLVEPYLDTGRNITTDNFFTSLNLAEILKARNTSLVGTVNRARREIPHEVKTSRIEVNETYILEHNGCTLTVYQGKVNKNVLILSTMHSSVDIGEDKKKLPETVSFYNSSKYGVDVADQMSRHYSTKAASRRWPLQVFYNILDLAGINSWVLYRKCTGANISRRNFILKLAEELREGHLRKKQEAVAVHATPAFEGDGNTETETTECRKRRQCQVFKCNGNKTLEVCGVCKKFVCGKCTAKVIKKSVCVNCK